MGRKRHEINIGDRFGKLIVQSFAGYDKSESNPLWNCLCDCGRESTPSSCNLANGNTTQCRRCKWDKHVNPDSSTRRAFGMYARQAKSRSLSFELTFEQFKDMVTENCFYCGVEPRANSYSSESSVSVPMTGVDRLDSSLGYSPDNCVPCCGTCNKAKLDRTPQEFIDWIRRAADHLRTHNG